MQKQQAINIINDKITQAGFTPKESLGFPGWQLNELGREENADFAKSAFNYTSRCAVYCKSCKVFIGRWMIPMEHIAWCKKCVDEGKDI